MFIYGYSDLFGRSLISHAYWKKKTKKKIWQYSLLTFFAFDDKKKIKPQDVLVQARDPITQ